MTILLSEGYIVTMSGDTPSRPEIGWVGIVEDRIAMVSYQREDAESFISSHPTAEIIDCLGRVIMPGLINTHTHVSMSLMRNYADDRSINDWLNNYIWPFESHQTDGDIEAGSRLSIAEMLLGGTTTMVDMYMESYNVANAAKEMGIRAQIDECVISEDRLEHSLENISKCISIVEGNPLLSVGIDPHAPYTCTPNILERVSEYSVQHSLPISTHLCEGVTEREDIYSRYGLYPAQYMDKYHIIGDRTILAHSIHLDAEDIDLIHRRGASVSHSPQSNMKLGSGVAPVVELIRAGVNVTLSTDGVSSNNDHDMWEEMRTALLLQRVTTLDPLALTAYETLQMATCNGAKALGREGELGVIREGAIADIIVVNMRSIHQRPNGNLYSTLLFCTKSSDVEHVIVGGGIRVFNRELLIDGERVDLELLIRDVEDRRAHIISKMGK